MAANKTKNHPFYKKRNEQNEFVIYNSETDKPMDKLGDGMYFTELPNTTIVPVKTESKSIVTQEVIEQPIQNKEGIDFVFEQAPELSNIGTKEQYSQYLDTIFPDSKVKDIVYHGTNKEFNKFDLNAEKSTIAENGIFFAPTKNQVMGTYGERVVVAVINSNPLISDDRIERISDRKKNEILNSGYTGYIYSYNKTISSADDIVVFEPEQVHILGSKQDIQGFKEFVQGKPKSVKPGVEELFESNPKLSNAVYEALGFNFRYTSEKWKDDPTKSNEIIVKEELLSS